MKRIKRIALLLLLLLLAMYAVTSYFNYAVKINGAATFPLDDAWIFWGFSKTFAHSGVFSINDATPPGAGVTSPAYMLILALFLKLGLNNEFLVNLAFNGMLLWGAAFLLYKIIDFEIKNSIIAFIPAVLFILDPRAAAIANSGMETFLFIFVQLSIFYWLQRNKFSQVFFFIGLGVWIRPEIIILMPIILLVYRKVIKWKDILYFILPFLGYFIFLKVFTGNFWLNTARAKYDFYSYISWWDYLVASLAYLGKTVFPFIGLFFIISLFRFKEFKKHKHLVVVLLYISVFWLAFLFYLPVLYHWGRYIFPLIPLLMVVAWLPFKEDTTHRRFFRYGIYVVLSAALIIGIFNFEKGKNVFANENRDFLRLHIKLSFWIKENLPAQARIATHDIGALGYFTGREIIDIVGLMDKRALGISRNPDKIKLFLDEKKCEYIAVLNSWFVVLNSELLYETPANSRVRFQLYRYSKNTEIVRLDLWSSGWKSPK